MRDDRRAAAPDVLRHTDRRSPQHLSRSSLSAQLLHDLDNLRQARRADQAPALRPPRLAMGTHKNLTSTLAGFAPCVYAEAGADRRLSVFGQRERGQPMSSQPNERGEPSSGQTEWARILWHSYLTGDRSQLNTQVKVMRQIFKRLPSEPRCRVCNAPFRGLGGAVVSVFGFGAGRSSFNPSLCDRCEKIVRKHQVGTEIQLTMLFADVRGSTNLAEDIGASAFQRLINRYYKACTEVLSQTNALINRLIGDALIGLYAPGIAGPEHARTAVEAARALLEATGHADPEGPWIQVGVGVHTGTVYVGAVGSSDSVSDITVLGDAANTAARLASQALPGEILVSENTCHAAKLKLEDCELRTLKLKGRHEPVAARVIRVSA